MITTYIICNLFKIGFNRAAKILDELYDEGIVGPEEGTRPRKIVMSPEQLDRYFDEEFSGQRHSKYKAELGIN